MKNVTLVCMNNSITQVLGLHASPVASLPLFLLYLALLVHSYHLTLVYPSTSTSTSTAAPTSTSTSMSTSAGPAAGPALNAGGLRQAANGAALMPPAPRTAGPVDDEDAHSQASMETATDDGTGAGGGSGGGSSRVARGQGQGQAAGGGGRGGRVRRMRMALLRASVYLTGQALARSVAWVVCIITAVYTRVFLVYR